MSGRTTHANFSDAPRWWSLQQQIGGSLRRHGIVCGRIGHDASNPSLIVEVIVGAISTAVELLVHDGCDVQACDLSIVA
eukprot:3383696-Amphidinium_carterae.1